MSFQESSPYLHAWDTERSQVATSHLRTHLSSSSDCFRASSSSPSLTGLWITSNFTPRIPTCSMVRPSKLVRIPPPLHPRLHLNPYSQRGSSLHRSFLAQHLQPSLAIFLLLISVSSLASQVRPGMHSHHTFVSSFGIPPQLIRTSHAL